MKVNKKHSSKVKPYYIPIVGFNLTTIILLAALVMVPVASLAIAIPTEPARDTLDIKCFISTAVTIIWWIFLTIAVIMVVATGVMFLIAQGEPPKLEIARKVLIFAVIGIIVALLGYFALETINKLINPEGSGSSSACAPPPPASCLNLGALCTTNSSCCSLYCEPTSTTCSNPPTPP